MLLRSACLSLALCTILAYAKPDCAELENGHYVIGCSHIFYRCFNQGRYEYRCPKTLYFNPITSKCDMKSHVKVCSEEGIRQHKGEIIQAAEFSCKHRKTGDYAHPAIPCDKYYYSCNEGVANLMICPPQQYFDNDKKTCELKMNVPACLLKKRVSGYSDLPLPGDSNYAPAAYPAPPMNPTAAPAPSRYETASAPGTPEPAVFEMAQDDTTPKCDSNVDRVFSDAGCVAYLWKCANGRLMKYHCPTTLFYDAEINQCSYKEHVPACGGARPLTTVAPAFAPASDTACLNKPDGIHDMGHCLSSFLSCTGGVGRVIPCQSSLVFDGRIRACSHIENCIAELPAADVQPPIETVYRPHGNIGLVKPPPALPALDFDCSPRPDGIYAHANCDTLFVRCTAGKPYTEACPSGLFYSEYSSNCDYLERCKENIGKIPTSAPAQSQPSGRYSQYTTVATVPAVPLPASDAPAYHAPSVAASPLEIDFSCAEKNDGAHAIGTCNTQYAQCNNKQTIIASCQPGLIFNQYNGQCDYSANVPDCNPGMDIPTTTTPAPTVQPTYRPTQLPEIVDPFCERLADGIYGTGRCSATFYQCVNMATKKLQCHAGLFYDEKTASCNFKAYIEVCGGQPKPLPARDVPTTPAPTYRPRATTLPSFDCAGKSDGLYALPMCTPYYAQCFYGKTTLQACADGLFYNERPGMCDYKENVPSCGGRLPASDAPSTTLPPTTLPPTTVAPAPTYRPTRAPYAPVTTSYVSVPTTVLPAADSTPLFSCVTRQEGYYSSGCSHIYYSCVKGYTHRMYCPAGLKFAQEQGYCEQKEHVPECGGTPIVIEHAPVAATESPLFSCKNKADGHYEIAACSSVFATCIKDVFIPGKCLESLVFNIDRDLCDYKHNTPTCGALYVPTAAPTLPPTTAAPQNDLQASFCNGRADAFYPTGDCANSYIQCSYGRTIRGNCPSTLVFDVIKGLCNNRDQVPACGAAQDSTVPSPYRARPNNDLPVQRPQAPYTPQPAPARGPYKA